MKSHEILMNMVLADASIRCCTSTTRDSKTISRRIEDEGLSFLTITLPAFAKDFERGLERGKVDSTLFAGYAKNGRLPKLFRGFVSLVFDSKTGVLLDDPSIDAIHSVRQVCYLFSKLELPCTPVREGAAFLDYIKCEQSVRDTAANMEPGLKAEFQHVSGLLFDRMFSKLDRKVYHGEVIPKHGPGATADRIRGNAKYSCKTWTERLEEVFPAMDYLYSSPRHYFNDVEDGVGPDWLDPGAEIPVRVVSVPKTLKTPRIIAIEPVHMQYVQQGIMELIVAAIQDNDNILHHFIGFDDQLPNRAMACQGSKDGSLATLDLSEASDRVSTLHVELLLGNYHWLASGVMACRSTKAEVPGWGVQTLSKFASMGSALTFPMEAMVFLTAVFMGIRRELNTQISEELISEFIGKVRVYGDDIIVPVEYVRSVIDVLEALGLQVNVNKSFWTGRFRESCGGDYYAGHDVTVVKARRELPSLPKHVQEVISVVSLRNQMYLSGLWITADFLDELIREIIPFPNVQETSPCLGRLSYLGYESQRECPTLQRSLVRGAVVVDRTPESNLGGKDALLKCLLKRGDEPFADSKHLARAGRPECVDIKLRWVTPY